MTSDTNELPLGFALVEVTRLLRASMDRAFETAGLELTAGEARALAYVSQYAGLRQGEIAEHMGVEPMTLVGYLDRLAARGLVRREPDPTDRRAKIVVPTPEAVPAVAHIRRVAAIVRREAMAGLPPEEVDVLRRSLGRMRANLGRARKAVPA